MYVSRMTELLKDSKFFNRLLPAGDYAICMYLSGQPLINDNYVGDYDIVVVTGHTTDLRPDEMLMFGSYKIRWIYLSLAMFTTFKEYFKYNYIPTYEYNDLFLYSLYFVSDNKVFYINPDHTADMTKLYSIKKSANIKKFIKYAYQYNEELIDTFNSDNLAPIKKYLYHFLIMSYIMNNESLSVAVLDNIKRIQSIVSADISLSVDDRKLINDRFSLFRTLCK